MHAPASAIPWILASARVHQNIEWVRSWVENENPDAAAAFDFEWMKAKRIAQLRQEQNGHRPVQNKWTDVCAWVYRLKLWRLTDWSWVKLGSSASRAASTEIAVIDDQRKAKAELLPVVLTATGYFSLPLENSDQPLVFQVARVSSAPLKVLRGVQWPAPSKTVGLHLAAQVVRIWRGSVTDGNITILPEGGRDSHGLAFGSDVVRAGAFPHEVDVC